MAAGNERVHQVVQVIIDTLQTLPALVYLIPVIMLFSVGDFSAMIAIVLYALVPSLSIEVSESDCCGVAGTWCYDRDRHDIATAVGRSLVDRIAESAPDAVVCDSETCRWNITASTRVPCVHPVEILDDSLRDSA